MSSYVNNEKRNVVTAEYLNECFRYDDGRLFWKVRPLHHFRKPGIGAAFNNIYAGQEAFKNINKQHGYAQGSVNAQMMLRRYVVFVMMKGYAPTKSIKSFDGDKQNDRIENLYEHGRKEEFTKEIEGNEE